MTRCQLRITVGGQNESCLKVQNPHHGTVVEYTSLLLQNLSIFMEQILNLYELNLGVMNEFFQIKKYEKIGQIHR